MLPLLKKETYVLIYGCHVVQSLIIIYAAGKCSLFPSPFVLKFNSYLYVVHGAWPDIS